jgi:hypothetical protein
MDGLRWTALIVATAALAGCTAPRLVGSGPPTSIASQITSIISTAPAGSSLMSWESGPLWGPLPPDVDPANQSPPLLCVSGKHYGTDSPNCGDLAYASAPYGIINPYGSAAIGIGVAVPVQNGIYGPVKPVYIQSGDASCDAFANNGKQGQPPTQWWEFSGGALGTGGAQSLTATVGFVANAKGQYYAQLTGCALTF